MSNSVFILGIAERFSKIVIQTSNFYNGISMTITNRFHCMLPHIIAVMGIILDKSNAGRNLRNDNLKNFREIFQQPIATTRHDLQKFVSNALGGNIKQKIPLCKHCIGSFPLDAEMITSRKAHCSENTECIFLKPLFRITDTNNFPIQQVILTIKIVNDFSVDVRCHRIHRKVTAAQILFQIANKFNLVWMTMIRVIAIFPISCDLIWIFQQNGQCSMLESSIQHTKIREHFFHLVWQSIGTNIPIVRCSSNQAVTNTTADHKRLISCIYQHFHQTLRFLWNLHQTMTCIKLPSIFRCFQPPFFHTHSPTITYRRFLPHFTQRQSGFSKEIFRSGRFFRTSLVD